MDPYAAGTTTRDHPWHEDLVLVFRESCSRNRSGRATRRNRPRHFGVWCFGNLVPETGQWSPFQHLSPSPKAPGSHAFGVSGILFPKPVNGVPSNTCHLAPNTWFPCVWRFGNLVPETGQWSPFGVSGILFPKPVNGVPLVFRESCSRNRSMESLPTPVT